MKNHDRKISKGLIFGLFILILVFAFNIYLLSGQSIRLDESQSIWVSSKPLSAIIKLTGEDVHVPLYSVLLHFWMQVFGTGVITVRALSFIFFLLTLPVLYKLSKESGNIQIARLTVILFSLSPFIIWFSTEARMYSLFIFISTVNSLLFLRMKASSGKTDKLAYLATLIAGLYTHYFFAFLIITQSFLVMINYIRNHKFLSHSTKSFTGKFSVILLVAALFFLPWLYYSYNLGVGSNTQPLIPSPTSFNIFLTYYYFIFGFQPASIQSILVSFWPILVVVLFLIFTQKQMVATKRIEYFVLITFLPVLLVFLISLYRPIFLSRYLIFITPGLFFLISWVIFNFTKRSFSLATVALLASMVGFLMYQNLSSQNPVKEDYRSVALYLSSNAKPQDIVIVTPPFTVYPVEYSYTGTARISSIPEWNRYQQGSIPDFELQKFVDQVEYLRTVYSRVFVVFSYDQGFEDDIKFYMDKNYELLEKRSFSPGLEVRTYRLRYDINL